MPLLYNIDFGQIRPKSRAIFILCKALSFAPVRTVSLPFFYHGAGFLYQTLPPVPLTKRAGRS
jgi:hypothetical protein